MHAWIIARGVLVEEFTPEVVGAYAHEGCKVGRKPWLNAHVVDPDATSMDG